MKIKIIAELAQGYEGKRDQAIQLVRAASLSGADAAKLQLVYADELCTPDNKHYEQSTTLEMSDNDWCDIKSVADALKVDLYLDIFGPKSLALAEHLGVPAIKIHGTDLANHALLEKVLTSSIPCVHLGAGGGTRSEIEKAVQALASKQVVVMHGFQGYPTAIRDNFVSRLSIFSQIFKTYKNVSLGMSDHADPTTKVAYLLAAIGLGAGAVVFEKHLTLSRIMKFEDFESALNPDEFLEFSNSLRQCAESWGKSTDSDDFGMPESERKYRSWTRKHVVATRNLDAGEVIAADMITLKRTSARNALTTLEALYGKTLREPVYENSPICSEMIDK